MYSLSLDHSGRSSHESRERGALGFLVGGVGELGRFDRLWRMLGDMMGAVDNKYSSAKIIFNEQTPVVMNTLPAQPHSVGETRYFTTS